MANTKWQVYTGEARFMKIYEPDFFEGVGKYKAPIVVSKETLDKMKEAGIRRQPKDDPDGKGKLVTFTRDFTKEFEKGKITFFCPPSIYDRDGKALVEYYNRETNKRVTQFTEEEKDKIERRGKEVLIGNGSIVELRIAVYDAGKFRGSRLEAIRIIDLIEYTRPEYKSELADAEGTPFDVDTKVQLPEKKQEPAKTGW